MAKRLLTVKQLKKDDANGPNINLRGDLRIILLEAFRGLIPICSDALRCQFNLILALIKCLAQAEVSNFDLSIVENNILRLQIIMDNLMLLVV